MEPMEVIDLSSDDEKSPPKRPDTGSSVLARIKRQSGDREDNVNREDVEICNVVKNQKRTIDKENEVRRVKKKIKFTEKKCDSEIIASLLKKKNDISLLKINRIKPKMLSPRCTLQHSKSQATGKSGDGSSLNMKTNGESAKSLNDDSRIEDKLRSPENRNGRHFFKINEGASSSTQITKPLLTVKNKINMSEISEPVSTPSAEELELFLDACRSQDPSRDMEKIIAKLKKRYSNLQPSYAKSGSFIQLVRQKRGSILNNRSKLFMHISEVMDEMKARQIQKRHSVREKINCNAQQLETPTQSGTNDVLEEDTALDEEVSVVEDDRDRERLLALDKAMRRCERYINKCEMAEVDFNDENDSHYIMAEKYKCRMVELYNKYCEITGERPDAARPYLRPKHLSVTPLPSLNNAITSFINMKITNINKSLVRKKKNGGQLRLTDALIFPDYLDILNCVQKCNDEQDLQLNKTKQEAIAKAAFSDLGVHLQRYRQADYYDTFSLYLEKEGRDPALENKELAEKLLANQEIGKKKLDQVFQDFVEKQQAAKLAGNGSGPEKEEDEKTDDESSEGTDDESSDASNEIITTGVDSDSDESRTDKVSTELRKDPNEQSSDNLEPDKHANANKETNENEEFHNSPNPFSDEKIDEESISMDISLHSADTIIGDLEIATESAAATVLQQKEVNCEVVEQTRIDPVTNKPAEPEDTGKTTSPPSPIRKQASENETVDTTESTLPSSPVQRLSPVSETVDAVKKTSAPSTAQSIASTDELGDTGKGTSPPSLIQQPVSINRAVETTSDAVKTVPPPSPVRKTVSTNETIDLGDTAESTSLSSPIRKPASTNRVVDTTSGTIKTASPPSPVQKLVFVKETVDVSDVVEIASPRSAIGRPESTVATCKVKPMQALETLEINLTDECSPVVTTDNIKVIDAPVVAPTVKPIVTEEAKKPILRLRQFAKPPGSWMDPQSPIENIIAQPQTVGKADADAETKKNRKVLPVDLQQSKVIKLNKPIPVRGRTIQVKNDILTNLKNKKSTVMIPMNLHGSSPRINVKTVTNNVTLNFTNAAQFQPGSTSAGSQGSKPARSLLNIDQSGKILTNCGNVGVISIGDDDEKVSQKSHPVTKVKSNGQNTPGFAAQRQIDMAPPKCGADQQRPIVRDIPLVIKHGKKTIYRIVSCSPGSAARNAIQPSSVMVAQNQTTSSPNKRPNCDSSIGVDPNLKLRVSDSIKKTLSFKVSGQPTNTVVNKVYDAPAKSVPTYVIE